MESCYYCNLDIYITYNNKLSLSSFNITLLLSLILLLLAKNNLIGNKDNQTSDTWYNLRVCFFLLGNITIRPANIQQKLNDTIFLIIYSLLKIATFFSAWSVVSIFASVGRQSLTSEKRGGGLPRHKLDLSRIHAEMIAGKSVKICGNHIWFVINVIILFNILRKYKLININNHIDNIHYL